MSFLNKYQFIIRGVLIIGIITCLLWVPDSDEGLRFLVGAAVGLAFVNMIGEVKNSKTLMAKDEFDNNKSESVALKYKRNHE